MAKPSDSLGLLLAAGPAESEEESSDDGATLAAEGVLKAIKRNDAAALSRALKEHYEHCKGDSTEVEDDYEDLDD